MDSADLAAWVGAVTGTSALLWQGWREVRTASRRHAELVSVVADSYQMLVDRPVGVPSHHAKVTNGGVQPIRAVVVTFVHVDHPNRRDVQRVETIGPGVTEQVQASHEFNKRVSGEAGVSVWLSFRDADQRVWTINPRGQLSRGLTPV